MPSIEVPIQNPRIQYVANAAQTTFAYPFLLFDEGDVVVVVDGVTQTITTDYSVTAVGVEAGGNIVFGAGLTSGEIVTIFRRTQIGRQSQYQQDGTFDAPPLERDFDYLTTIAQENRRDIDRSFRMNIEDNDTVTELPAPIAGRSLKWNAGGDGLVNSTFDPDAAQVAAAASAATAATQAGIATTQAGISTTQAGLSNTARIAAEAAQAAAEAAAGTAEGTRIDSPDDASSIILANGQPIEVTAPNGFDLNGAEVIGATEWITLGFIEVAVDQAYDFLNNVPYPFNVLEVTTISTAGTATLTFSDGTTSFGGTANSVSTSSNSQTHSADNSIAAGGKVVGTVTANAAAEGITINAKIRRTAL